ncbi:hypothetical protein FACS1894153_2230 [Bacteroidia bacterium]|nr:hypothetical protein FACS1894153_2230 [Bacteroidia bacterium]
MLNFVNAVFLVSCNFALHLLTIKLKTMKKVLSIVAIASLFTLAACNTTPKTAETETEATEVVSEEAPATEEAAAEAPAEAPVEEATK